MDFSLLSPSKLPIKTVYHSSLVIFLTTCMFICVYLIRHSRKRSDVDGDQSNTTDNNSNRNSRNKKKKKTELKNFYQHQIRREKVEKLELLRKRFEEDKEKVAKMKNSRMFKPH